MKLKLTLSNNFHGTSVTLLARSEGKTDLNNYGEEIPIVDLSPGQVQRAKRTLCGISGCMCSGSLGLRGPQEQNVAIYCSQDRLF